jgi:protein-L-isoaspartate(D-aspartate) O-methyltransferase
VTITESEFAELRQRMVVTQLVKRGIRDPRVLAAMGTIPRHEFVDPALQGRAYEDSPLPIGEAQTISQPYIVALTLELLHLQPEHVVLEIGTGSGYQTALLAELSRHVYSIERHPALVAQAQAALNRLAYRNVTVSAGDGSVGWPERAPYDAIAVSAAAPEFPQALFVQLREGGRMVVPVGSADAQMLELVVKEGGQALVSAAVPCRFVPLIGVHGYQG